MHVEFSRDKFSEVIGKLEKVTGKNLTLPALAGIMIDAENNTVSIRATNLDVGAEIKIPAKVKSTGKALVPGSILSHYLSSNRGEKSISIEIDDNVLKLSSDSQSVKINTLPMEDFPIIPKPETVEEFEIPSEELVRGLRAVWYASSANSMKPELSSVYFAGEGETLVMVGTDSFRLAEKRIKIKQFFSGAFLLPVKNVSDVIRMFEGENTSVTVKSGKNQVSFISGDTYMVSRTTEGSFPDYKQIIPKETKTEAVLLREDLSRILKTATIFADKFNQINVEVSAAKKKFSVSTRNSDVGEYKEEVVAAITGEDVSINFNHKYIADCLQSVASDSVSMSMNGQGKPIIIRPVGDKSFLYLAMPMNR